MKQQPDPSTLEPHTGGLRLHRRSFLQAAGFSLAAVATGCQRPAPHSSRPYLEAPEDVVPGRPLYYASVCDACSAGCGTLVKVRDGRPIKLEGLDEHPGSGGGLCAMGQASLLGLYDSHRLRGPRLAGRDASWPEVDEAIRKGLAEARRAGRGIRLLTPSLLSPTERAAAARFADHHDAVHVVHDPLSASAILGAHQQTHGRRLLPRYRFEEADLILALDADFLGTWISPVEYAAGYRAGRRPEGPSPRRSYHVQLEPTLTLSGCKADRRLTLRPHEISSVVSALAHALAPDLVPAWAPENGSLPADLPADLSAAVADLARQLRQVADGGGHSLIVSGSDEVATQVVINLLNHHLGNYAATVDLERPSFQRQGDDDAFAGLLTELRGGNVGVLLVAGLDPLHEFEGAGLQDAFGGVDLLVSLSPHLDATAAASGIVCPTHHFLESWGDAEPFEGLFAVRQPGIAPLWDTRSLRAGLDAWSAQEAAPRVDDLAAVQAYWRQEVHPRDPRRLDFQSFWDRSLHDGFALLPPKSAAPAWVPDSRTPSPKGAQEAGDAFTLVLYPKVGLGAGRHGDNPWLHELPDPISKVTWGNYACLSPSAALRLGVADGDIVRLHAGEAALELPTLVQPGQHDAVVAVAMGYGDRRSERFHDIGPDWIGTSPSTGDDGRVGANGARLFAGIHRVRHGITVEPTGGHRDLAKTQQEDRSDRDLVQEVEFAALGAGNGGEDSGEHGQKHADLYPDDHRVQEYAAHPARKWGMTIDLDACTGCSACVIACQAENNLPVVGYDEVRRHRDLQWMRIDRYYAGTDPASFGVGFQPMLCQHCDQAPCETVCPVLATVQTEEGLNAQAYNRCVGTRYCANNCPFKVRRFNWFDYRRDDPVANLVLNPDVVVRTRGVMEKCSFCVQRIENAKIEARRRGEVRVREDEARPACQQTCPADAIVFGDVLDPASRVAASRSNPRGYRLLEELNVQPSVEYLRRVRRQAPGGDESHEPDQTEGGPSHG